MSSLDDLLILSLIIYLVKFFLLSLWKTKASDFISNFYILTSYTQHVKLFRNLNMSFKDDFSILARILGLVKLSYKFILYHK